MKNKHLTKRILAIPCALAIIATMGVSTAYAAGKSTASSAKPTTVSATNKTRKAADTKPKKELTDAQKAEMKTKMQERLKKELADGKITKAQYNEQLKSIEEGKIFQIGRGGHGETKKLTDAQKAEMKTKMQERLKKELADGKITKAQYNEQLKVIAEGKMPKMEGKCVKPAKTQ